MDQSCTPYLDGWSIARSSSVVLQWGENRDRTRQRKDPPFRSASPAAGLLVWRPFFPRHVPRSPLRSRTCTCVSPPRLCDDRPVCLACHDGCCSLGAARRWQRVGGSLLQTSCDRLSGPQFGLTVSSIQNCSSEIVCVRPRAPACPTGASRWPSHRGRCQTVPHTARYQPPGQAGCGGPETLTDSYRLWDVTIKQPFPPHGRGKGELCGTQLSAITVWETLAH
jgi:hypothetical protein